MLGLGLELGLELGVSVRVRVRVRVKVRVRVRVRALTALSLPLWPSSAHLSRCCRPLKPTAMQEVQSVIQKKTRQDNWVQVRVGFNPPLFTFRLCVYVCLL